MKLTTSLFPIIALASTTSACAADSLVVRDLQQLRDQRDKAVAAAVAPINQRYQASLEQLLRRATQLKDQEGVAQVTKAIESANEAAASAGAVKLTAKTLPKRLANTVWTSPNGFWIPRMQFLPGDKVLVTFKSGQAFTYPFKATGDEEVTFQIDVNPVTVIKFAPDLLTATSGTFDLKKE